MANSTAVITDLATLDATAFSSASLSKAKAAGMDIDGMAELATVGAADLKRLLKLIAANCDSGDAQLTLTNNILGTLA